MLLRRRRVVAVANEVDGGPRWRAIAVAVLGGGRRLHLHHQNFFRRAIRRDDAMSCRDEMSLDTLSKIVSLTKKTRLRTQALLLLVNHMTIAGALRW